MFAWLVLIHHTLLSARTVIYQKPCSLDFHCPSCWVAALVQQGLQWDCFSLGSVPVCPSSSFSDWWKEQCCRLPDLMVSWNLIGTLWHVPLELHPQSCFIFQEETKGVYFLWCAWLWSFVSKVKCRKGTERMAVLCAEWSSWASWAPGHSREALGSGRIFSGYISSFIFWVCG